MTVATSRFLTAALTALALGLPGCSGEEAELALDLAGPPKAYLLKSHGISIGWILAFDVILAERGGVDVGLERMEVFAVDRGTQQVFGPSVYERTTLEQEGWSELRAGERRTLSLQLGLAPVAPQGPIAVTLHVRGTSLDGRPVAAQLSAEYPLVASPP